MATDKTPDPTAPGGADFDIDNASAEALTKHVGILQLRAQARTLSQPAATGEQLAPTGDIRAVNEAGEVRYFNQETWDALEEKGEHAGWEISVAEPSKDL